MLSTCYRQTTVSTLNIGTPYNTCPQILTSPVYNQGPVVQSIISLTSLLMINLLTVVAKVFSTTLIFFIAKM